MSDDNEDITAVEGLAMSPRFVVAPGHTIYHGGCYKAGDVVSIDDQEQMNNWIEDGVLTLE